MPRRDKQDYDAHRFRGLVEPLLEQRDESYRQASMAAGLDEAAISRFFRGTQPMRDSCIALADHFELNPNRVLEAAGYAPLSFFKREKVDLSEVSPEAKRLLEKVERLAPHHRDEFVRIMNVVADGLGRREEDL